jgi:tight adherence protein B
MTSLGSLLLLGLVSMLVALAVLALFWGLRRLRQEDDEDLPEQLGTWLDLEPGGRAGRRDEGRHAGGPGGSQRRGAAEKIQRELAQADLKLTVREWLLIRVGAIVGLFLVGFLLQRNLLVGAMLGAVGYFLPTLILRMRQGRRLKAFDRQLPDVLDQLVGSLRVGYGLSQSVEWVSQQMPDPAAAEFDRVVREMQLGQTLPQSLESMVRRIDSKDLALIVTAIKIQHESGGNLAEILEIVAHTIRERVRVQREIDVLTAQQRYSGYTMMVLPIGIAFLLFAINPDYMMGLFTPGPTLCIPVGAGIMMILGFFVMRRIINIEV